MHVFISILLLNVLFRSNVHFLMSFVRNSSQIKIVRSTSIIFKTMHVEHRLLLLIVIVVISVIIIIIIVINIIMINNITRAFFNMQSHVNSGVSQYYFNIFRIKIHSNHFRTIYSM